MTRRPEVEMYQPVSEWFRTFLAGKIRRADIEVFDTHATPLNEFIRRHQLQGYFESDLWQTFDIRVDVTGFVRGPKLKGVAFVECKTTPLSLSHLSQLLGYSRVAAPIYSYLISPSGVGGILRSLILTYDRSDILEYHWPRGGNARKLILARWDLITRTLDATSILPPDSS